MLIDERDGSGTLVARYVSSKSGKDESGSRIDIIVCKVASLLVHKP